MNHTPKPWTFNVNDVHNNKPNCFLITDGTEDKLNGIAVACIHKEHAQRIANAKLIAAAPDLLEALQGLAADSYLADPINSERMAKAFAAIKKATV